MTPVNIESKISEPTNPSVQNKTPPGLDKIQAPVEANSDYCKLAVTVIVPV